MMTVMTTSGAQQTTTTWHGSDQAWYELVRIVAGNCTCDPLRWRDGGTLCAPHHMLRHDQRALDGLLFATRIVESLCREENVADSDLRGD